jgi:hypothetical protein
VDAPSRESFNEAMLSLNSAQYVEIRLIYKKCVLRPRHKRLAYGWPHSYKYVPKKPQVSIARSIAVHFPAVLVRPGRGTAHTTNDGERGGMQEGCGRLDSLKVLR